MDFDGGSVSVCDVEGASNAASAEDILSRVRFLTAEESLARIRPIIKAVQQFRPSSDAGMWMASLMKPAFLLMLGAHANTVAYLKDSPAPSLVPWDERTGFPAISALVGDAHWWRKQTDGMEHILLSSFGEWACWKRETLQCACRSLRNRMRPLELDIMIRHDLTGDDNTLILRVSGGVQSRDKAFWRHFGKAWAYRVSDTLIGIPLDACLMRIRNREARESPEIEMRRCGEEKIGEEFSRDVLYAMLRDAFAQMSQSRDREGGAV